MEQYKPAEFLSNFPTVEPFCTTVKPPYWRLSGDGSAHVAVGGAGINARWCSKHSDRGAMQQRGGFLALVRTERNVSMKRSSRFSPSGQTRSPRGRLCARRKNIPLPPAQIHLRMCTKPASVWKLPLTYSVKMLKCPPPVCCSELYCAVNEKYMSWTEGKVFSRTTGTATRFFSEQHRHA